jgi:hypothetical protein
MHMNPNLRSVLRLRSSSNHLIRQVLLLGCICILSSIAWGHEDFSTVRQFGRVIVRVTSGFNYEEIQKVWITGELASRMLTKSGYQDTVILDFVHCYGRNVSPEYYLATGTGVVNTQDGFQWYGLRPLVSGPAVIVLRERSSQFDVEGALKVLEYGVQHNGDLKRRQMPVSYWIGLPPAIVESIDTAETRRVANSRSSREIQEIMQTRVYRQGGREWETWGGVTYYWLGGRYFVQSRQMYSMADDTNATMQHSDTTLFVTPNIYQFADGQGPGTFIFDSDSTFFYVNPICDNMISKKHHLASKKISLEPFSISGLGVDKVTITYQCESSNKTTFGFRTMVYQISKDYLTQDLDALLNSSRHTRKAP